MGFPSLSTSCIAFAVKRRGEEEEGGREGESGEKCFRTNWRAVIAEEEEEEEEESWI